MIQLERHKPEKATEEVVQHKSLVGNTNLTMLFVMLVLSVVLTLYSESIQVNDGLGFDGVFYAGIAKNFGDFPRLNIGREYVGRVLPSAIVYYSLRITNLPLTDRNIIFGFDFYKILMLSICALVWGLIADKLEIGKKGKWLGFIGLFINHNVLKCYFYYPISTDVTAFLFTFLMLYFYLAEQPVPILIVAMLGAFTWPTLLYQGMLLYVFPRQEIHFEKSNFLQRNMPAVVAVAVYLFAAAYLTDSFNKFLKGTMLAAVPLSAGIVCIYYFVCSHLIFGDRYFSSSRKLLRATDLKRVISALVLCAITLFSLSLLSSYNLPSSRSDSLVRFFFKSVVLQSLRRPAEFYIAHVIWFGPILLLTFRFFDRVVGGIRRQGWGIVLVFIMYICMSVKPTSRQSMPFFPFVVIFTVFVLNTRNLSYRFLCVFALFEIVMSKVWLLINTNFPVILFNVAGGFFSNSFYFIYGAIVVLLQIFTYVYFHLDRSFVSESKKVPG